MKLRAESPSMKKEPVVQKEFTAPDISRSYYKDKERQVHLRDYLNVIFRRKWIVIVFLTSVVITAMVATFFMKPLYKASTTIKLKSGKTRLVQFEDVYREGYELETEYNVLKSRSLADRVATRRPFLNPPRPSEPKISVHYITGLLSISREINKETPITDETRRVSVGTILNGLEIQPIKKSRLVNINFISEDPVFAANAANKIADEYVNFTEENKLKPTQLGGIRLKKEVEDMGARLQASEEQLNEYVAKSKFLYTRNDEDYENILSQKFTNLSQELNLATSERISRESIYEEVNKSGIDYSVVLQNSMIRSLTMDYAKLESEYFNLLKIHKPEYPKMIRLKDQIERLKKRIEAEEQKIINSLHTDYRLALKKENLLSSAIAKLREEVTTFQQSMINFQVLKREVETNRELYSTLLQRLKEVDISAALTESDVQVLDKAQIPRAPFKPRTAFNLGLSLIFGLFGGVFLAFFAEYFDNSIKTDEDIEKISSLPVLGHIPAIKTSPDKLINADSNGNNNSNSSIAFDTAIFSEAFRYLSTRIRFSNGKQPKQILITSPMTQDGKTIISLSLARSIMTSQEKAIIIDADLRRADVHTLFNLDNSTGLSSFLAGNSDFERLINKSPCAGLDVITSGPVPPNPSELLNSSLMKELVDALSLTYDYIIFDSAPVLGMSDSLILSTIADYVIVVVKANNTPADALIQTSKALNSVKANTIGIILNGVNTNKTYSYSSDYYHAPYLSNNRSRKELSNK